MLHGFLLLGVCVGLHRRHYTRITQTGTVFHAKSREIDSNSQYGNEPTNGVPSNDLVEFKRCSLRNAVRSKLRIAGRLKNWYEGT